MTTKTLDLVELLKTFSSTYDHARRMGAARPLAHKFGLADVLGEIETEITKRVDAVKAEAAREAARVRVDHAAALATERARVRALQAAAAVRQRVLTGGTITTDRITTGPIGTSAGELAAALRGEYTTTHDAIHRPVVVHPVTGKHLVRTSTAHALNTARWLNNGSLRASGYTWQTPAAVPTPAPAPRFSASAVGRIHVVRDRETGRLAQFGTGDHARDLVERTVGRLNAGTYSATSLMWDRDEAAISRRGLFF